MQDNRTAETILRQRSKAERFRQLHQRNGQILVLPNAWDAASARIFEEAGFSAIGTTSAGIAFALGFPDGQIAPREEMLLTVERVTRAVQVPVTADIEAGYDRNNDNVNEVVQTVAWVIAAGAVGINLEDSVPGEPPSLVDVGLQVERITAIRDLALSEDIPLVINARTDAFHLTHLDPKERFALAVARLNTYRSAGADCLFAPFVSDAATIGALAGAVEGPLNILAVAGSPSVTELERLGVARVSVGSGPYRATVAVLRGIATELSDQGTYESFTRKTIPYDELNRLMRHLPH